MLDVFARNNYNALFTARTLRINKVFSETFLIFQYLFIFLVMNKLKWTFQNSRLFSYSRCIASGGTEFVRGCDIHNQASCGNYYLMYAFCFGIRGGIVCLMLVIHSLATVWSSSINFFFIKNIFLLIGIFL